MPPRMKNSDDMKKKKTVIKQRFNCFKKKAMELSVLCGNSVGFICYGPDDNNLQIWPDPQTLSHLVGKFNDQSDEKRKKNACDINDFPDLKGLSVDELKYHLSCIDSQLEGIKQKKIGNIFKADCDHEENITPRVSHDVGIEREEDRHLLRVSDEDQRPPQLGFCNPFDELGYLVRGFTQNN